MRDGDVAPGGAPLHETWGAAFLLVRPDQHVAWRGDDPAAAAGALERACGWGRTDDEGGRRA
ncbi:hypothetical protein [Geodermatophilus africanus]|uniref:aromatic-ring hydroxylase C-terminal domain-containing protein n=1 Tax=Geodermatophilus africanus TaxID=1137993 RepID=UPI0031389A24